MWARRGAVAMITGLQTSGSSSDEPVQSFAGAGLWSGSFTPSLGSFTPNSRGQGEGSGADWSIVMSWGLQDHS